MKTRSDPEPGAFDRWLKQPYIGVILLSLAVLSIGAAVYPTLPSLSSFAGPQGLLLTVSLIATIVLAYKFPIYIRHNVKICVMSIPLFLMAALLPAPLAGFSALVALCMGELIVRKERGTHATDIATNISRWSLIVLLGAAVAHLPISHANQIIAEIPLFACAVALWVGDLLTLPLVLCPITRERPGPIILTTVREGGLAEAAQYGMGLLGVLLAAHQMWALSLLVIPAGLVYLAFKKEVDQDTFQLLESMADAVDTRDPYTDGHSRRVAELVSGLLAEVGMGGQEARQIIASARLHDIGKVGLPDGMLVKPAALSASEKELVELYPGQGAELLRGYPDFSRGLEMLRHHHERWDGKGYPLGLAGTDIPYGARIIAIVDAFDAMTSDRPYRRALTSNQAAQILLEGRGRQWDPTLVDAFLRSIAGTLSPSADALSQDSATVDSACPSIGTFARAGRQA